MKSAIIYWSQTGNTEAMAEAILEGFKEKSSDVELFEVTAITPEEALGYDELILGCPAMGAEELDEEDMEPFMVAIEGSLSGKKVGLFGSYGWGDGEWMRNWEERVEASGATLIAPGLIINETPDDEGIEECKEFGRKAA